MIEELLNYQNVDARLRAIEVQLGKSEERKKAVVAKKFLETVEESIAKLELKASELVAAYEKSQDELKKLQEQESEFTTAANNLEDTNGVDYLLKKTEELIAKIKNISSNAKKISEEIQSVLREYASIKTKTKQAQAQYKENAEKYNEFKKSFDEERKSIMAELEQLKKKVDPSLMERYLKKRENKIYPVVYEVSADVCGACNMQLSMNELMRLKNGEIIECDQCGRLLYQKQK